MPGIVTLIEKMRAADQEAQQTVNEDEDKAEAESGETAM